MAPTTFLDRCQDDVDHHSKHFGLAFGIMEIVLLFFGGYKNGGIMGISWCNMIGYEFIIFNDTLSILFPMDFMDSNGGCDVSVTSLK